MKFFFRLVQIIVQLLLTDCSSTIIKASLFMKDTRLGLWSWINEEIEDGAVLEAIVEGGVSVRLQTATLFFVVSEFLHY